MKEASCPSCGKESINALLCDFCGSIFVRSAKTGYNIKNLFKDNIINNTNHAIRAALEKNLYYQEIYDCDCFATQIFQSKTHWFELREPIDGMFSVFNSDFSLKPVNRGKRGNISVDISSSSLSKTQWQNFLTFPEFVLFDKEDDHWYKLDFGRDVQGAAYIIEKIITDVLGLTTDTVFLFTSVDCIIDGDLDDQEKWEQSQTPEIRERLRKRSDYNPF
jgi:hypothetical protein